MTSRLGLIGILVLLGAGWGLTQPLSKIVVSTGYLPFGIIFWQFLIGALLLTAVQALRRRPFRTDRPALVIYAVIAVIGTLLPNGASYLAYRHLPAGIMSILISTVPMIASHHAMSQRMIGSTFQPCMMLLKNRTTASRGTVSITKTQPT